MDPIKEFLKILTINPFSSLAERYGAEQETIEEVYEPFLIQEGFILRTPRGREVTDLAYRHLGRTKSSRQGDLF